MSSHTPWSLAVAKQFGLAFLIALSTHANAQAQCSFNQDLFFNPDIFPNLPSGYDGGQYDSESAALAAAKRAYFGPTGVYTTQSAEQVCMGRLMSMDLLLVNGANAATIPSFDAGEFIGVLAPGVSLLVIKAVDGRCNMGGLISTQDLVYAPGYVLTCTQASNTTLGFSGPTETRPAGTGGSSTLTLTAKTTANGVAKAGVAVSFTADVKATSGGHDHHSAARPKGTLSLAQGTTNANGELAVAFTAPEVAGIHTIKATCSSCTNTVVSQDVQVKVPDLLPISPNPPLSSSGTYVYALTSVDKTHQGNGRYHLNQYYLTDTSRQNLRALITEFSKADWGTVALNDASLYWGGRYDIASNWVGSHRGHREGREIDISFTRAQNPIPSNKQNDVYDKFCKGKKVQVPFSILHHYVTNPHYHVYLEKQTACWKSES